MRIVMTGDETNESCHIVSLFIEYSEFSKLTKYEHASLSMLILILLLAIKLFLFPFFLYKYTYIYNQTYIYTSSRIYTTDLPNIRDVEFQEIIDSAAKDQYLSSNRSRRRNVELYQENIEKGLVREKKYS